MLRRLNAQAVLDVLLAADECDGTELMAATGLSRPTVHGVCDDLIVQGLAVERPIRAAALARPGRPPRVYALRSAAAHVVGVDMGEATVRVAVADLRGRILAETALPFADRRMPAPARLATLRNAVALALREAAVAADDVRSVVLGVPAPVTAAGYAVAADTYLPGLAAVDLRGTLRPVLDAPVTVENDANLAVLAERWVGVAAGHDDAVLVLAGERLGAGLCLGGRLVRGHAGGAGEMGFLGLVSGVGDPTGVGRLLRHWTGQPAQDVFARARRGESAALDELDRVAGRVGRALAVLAMVLDPEVVVLGGGVADAGAVLMDPLRRAYAATLHERPLRATPALLASTLADRGSLLGAVRVALDELLPRLIDLEAAAVPVART